MVLDLRISSFCKKKKLLQTNNNYLTIQRHIPAVVGAWVVFRSKIKEKTWKTVLIYLVDSQWGKAGIASSLIQIQGIFLSSFWQVFGGNNFVGHRCTLVRQDLMTPKMFSSPTAPLCPANVAMYAELIFQCRTSTLPASLRL